jgi:hypothetical protein
MNSKAIEDPASVRLAMTRIVDTAISRCTEAEIDRWLAALVAIASALAPDLPAFPEWIREIFLESRAHAKRS